MLSVCIPVYNFNVGDLLTALKEQISSTQQAVELIVIDDASSEEFKQLNKNVVKDINYIELPENIGRAKIRNLFTKYATQPYLLFLDCDALLIHSNFLAVYLAELNNNPEVMCGGRVYPAMCPSSDKKLRWTYGIRQESKSSSERRKHPNRSFMTNNFIIKKTLLEHIRFDESLTQYGHEDTIFGIALAEQNIVIQHIENPILNGDIETNKVFLTKTDEAIDNLVQIYLSAQLNTKIVEHIQLLRFYVRYRPLIMLLRPLFLLIEKRLRRLLEKNSSSLKLFHLYKLSRFVRLYHTAKKQVN